MDPTATPVPVAANLLDVPDGYELIDGELVEQKMGAKSSWVGGRLTRLLDEFCEANRLRWVWPADTGYRCFGDRRTVRKPDVSFIRAGRLPNEEIPDGDLQVAPDLVVEVVSPNDTVYELDAMVEEYVTAGVPQVWVVNPVTRRVLIHRLDGSANKLHPGQELSGEDVVPGFRCPVDAFMPPAPAAMMNGPAA
jgi:Uma2 family endonuclease